MNPSITSHGTTQIRPSLPIQATHPAYTTVEKVLLACGILSSFYYIAINIFVPLQYAGYSLTSQTISELSAINAPTRSLWVLLCTFYSLLVIAFGWGIWKVAGENRKLLIISIVMMIYGISGFFWPPMHQRQVLATGGGTMTDTMHIVFTAVTVALMLIMLISGAATFGKRFRYYTVATIMVLLAFGILTGISSPAMAKNLPTRMIGVWERINIGVFMLWVIVFASVLLHKEKSTG